MDSFDHWLTQIQIKISYIKIKDIEIRKLVLGVLFLAAASNVMFMYYNPTVQVIAVMGILLLPNAYLIIAWMKVWPVASEMLKRAADSERYGTYKSDVKNYYPDFGNKYK